MNIGLASLISLVTYKPFLGRSHRRAPRVHVASANPSTRKPSTRKTAYDRARIAEAAERMERKRQRRQECIARSIANKHPLNAR